VKSQLEYKKVDVKDEVKTEAEVNAAKEDTAVDQVEEEGKLTDTVPFVESTVTNGNGGGYVKINRDTIPNPATLTSKAYLTGLHYMSATTTNPTEEATNHESETTHETEQGGGGNNNQGDGDNNQGSGDNNQGGNGGGNTVAVTGVSLSKGTVSLAPGKSETITATVSPDNAPDKTISVSSSNESVAKVSANGSSVTITAVGAGNATITVTAKGKPEIQATCAVTVAEEVVEATGVKLSTNAVTVAIGGTADITATVEPANAKDTSVTASVDKTDVATVTVSGNKVTVKGVKAGTATLTVKTANNKPATCAITVSEADNLTLNATTLKVAVNGTGTLTATTVPATATITKVESADTNIATATVKDKTITVTGKKAGKTKITVTGSNNKTAVCEVEVKNGAESDTTTKLKDKNGNQVYVLENGKYREAVYADYYKFNEFYLFNAEKLYTGWQNIDGKTYYYLADHKYVTGEQVIQGAKYNFGSDGVLQSGNGSFGIDVSKWNGNIDWKAVKNSGVSYVIIRCGYRGSSSGALIADPKFAANISGAKSAGLKVGVYFFTQAVNEVEAVEEASMVISQLSKYKVDYPVFLDVEAANGRADGIDKGTRTAVCKAFCATMANSGYKAGVYANKTWFTSKIDAGALGSYSIWLAQYAAKPTYGGRYNLWQYSSKGSIPGISGHVDLDLSYLGY
jgi:GH25 family lysozyme M1 (1,4-beta-N-acetylmuramidase)/uncharacterized protein YjdB